MVRTFQDLLTEKGDWRLNIGGMTFEGLGNEDDERLEITILKDEVFIALSYLGKEKEHGSGRYANILALFLGERKGLKHFQRFLGRGQICQGDECYHFWFSFEKKKVSNI